MDGAAPQPIFGRNPTPAQAADWLLVWARSPTCRRPPKSEADFIRLTAAMEQLKGFVDRGQHAKLAEYAGLVYGRIAGGAGTDGLSAATALFRGLNRPLRDRAQDDRYHVYSIPHPHSYVYAEGFGAKPPEPSGPRANEVFTVIADIAPARGPNGIAVAGRILEWNWVDAEEDDNGHFVPVNWKHRYVERIW